MKKVRIKGGRFKGKTFLLENEISKMSESKTSCLATLACEGNMAALNAIEIDKYTLNDAPFYYGKIDSLGYIISGKHLGALN